MFKFFRKKLLEGVIKDIISELPKLKGIALELFLTHKDEFIEKIKTVIMAEIKKLVKEKLD